MESNKNCLRLDIACVERGLIHSRQKAKECILRGYILLNDTLVYKPSVLVDSNDSIVLRKEPLVSRAGDKLYSFLEEQSNIQWNFKRVLDIGTSTGGFAQVLLQHPIDYLVCVDVGREQLHPLVAEDPRVYSFEGIDIRDFTQLFLNNSLGLPFANAIFDCITCDVSFISLEYIMPSIIKLLVDGGDIIVLFKPQFEVGKGVKRNKRGVVSDAISIQNSLSDFKALLLDYHFKITSFKKSLYKGKEGNEEFFFYCRRMQK